MGNRVGYDTNHHEVKPEDHEHEMPLVEGKSHPSEYVGVVVSRLQAGGPVTFPFPGADHEGQAADDQDAKGQPGDDEGVSIGPDSPLRMPIVQELLLVLDRVDHNLNYD